MLDCINDRSKRICRIASTAVEMIIHISVPSPFMFLGS
jgi:hypothetical protein